MLAIMLGLVVGKPVGIVAAAWLAVRTRHRGEARRLFLAAVVRRRRARRHRLHDVPVHRGAAFPDPADYAAAKIAIFLASLVAGALGVLILWPKPGRPMSATPE